MSGFLPVHIYSGNLPVAAAEDLVMRKTAMKTADAQYSFGKFAPINILPAFSTIVLFSLSERPFSSGLNATVNWCPIPHLLKSFLNLDLHIFHYLFEKFLFYFLSGFPLDS